MRWWDMGDDIRLEVGDMSKSIHDRFADFLGIVASKPSIDDMRKDADLKSAPIFGMAVAVMFSEGPVIQMAAIG